MPASEIVGCGSCTDPLIDPLRAASPSVPRGGPTPPANQTPGSGVWLQRWLLVLRSVIQATLDVEGSNPTPSARHSALEAPAEPPSKRQCTEGAHAAQATRTDESLSPDIAGAPSRSVSSALLAQLTVALRTWTILMLPGVRSSQGWRCSRECRCSRGCRCRSRRE